MDHSGDSNSNSSLPAQLKAWSKITNSHIQSDLAIGQDSKGVMSSPINNNNNNNKNTNMNNSTQSSSININNANFTDNISENNLISNSLDNMKSPNKGNIFYIYFYIYIVIYIYLSSRDDN